MSCVSSVWKGGDQIEMRPSLSSCLFVRQRELHGSSSEGRGQPTIFCGGGDSLERLSDRSCAAGRPNTEHENALYTAMIEDCQQLLRELLLPQTFEEIQFLLGLFHNCCGFCTPGKVLLYGDDQELRRKASHPLHTVPAKEQTWDGISVFSPV